MAGAIEDLEPAVRDQAMGPLAVRRRNHPVAASPHDQQRQLRRQIEPVGGAHALAARIDAGPQRLDERIARFAVTE